MRKRTLNFLIALALSLIFVGLGIWQLNRASDLQRMKNIEPDLSVVSLEKLVSPNQNLSSDSINRLITMRGRYVKSYLAENQKVKVDGETKSRTLEVRLFKALGGGEVLVVRGVQGIGVQELSGEVTVMGRLLPRQSSDQAKFKDGELTRLDPALVTGSSSNLYDGYVVAIKEANEIGQEIYTQRISADPAVSRVAGFYWQHITYVAIWWLFALLVLIAPFYDRLRNRKVRVR